MPHPEDENSSSATGAGSLPEHDGVSRSGSPSSDTPLPESEAALGDPPLPGAELDREYGTLAGGTLRSPGQEPESPSGATAIELTAVAGSGGSFPAFEGAIAWRLTPGQILAGRYRIVGAIAQGAAGEVYEAEDLELGERVALKTIGPDVEHGERTIVRLRREIVLARKVIHPNVCRTFDMFHEGSLLFVTTELINGATLEEFIRRTGPLSVEKARPLVRQIAEGLGAAHAAGIIHRDIKTASVILVEGQPGEEPRAVIADFGLARSVTPDLAGPTVTGAGDLVGTPAYMSPEQVTGEELTPRSDLFSLGVVIYEMLTGRLPFQGEGSLSSAVARLTAPPAPMRMFAPDVDPAWEAAVTRLLSRHPADRFGSAAELWRILDATAKPRAGRMASRGWLWATLGLIAIVLTVAVLLVLRKPAPAPPPAPASPPVRAEARAAAGPISPRPRARRSVAVAGLSNLSLRGDAEWLSTALGEMLTAELAAGEKLRVIPGESVARMRNDLELPATVTPPKDVLAQFRSNLDADYVVAGGYEATGAGANRQLRLDLYVRDTGSGNLFATFTQVGTESDLRAVVSRAGSQLRRQFGVGELSAEQTARTLSSLPPATGIARFWAEGLEQLRKFETRKALNNFELAAIADPRYAPVHSALSMAWAQLGDQMKATEEARLAMDMSQRLPRETRLSIEGRYRELSGEWDRAIRIYRTLFDLFPDDEDYALSLARAQVQGGRAGEAQETIEAVRKASQAWSGDPRTHLVAAEIAFALGEYQGLRDVAKLAAAAADDRGDRVASARARLFEGVAAWKLGAPRDAINAYTAAKTSFERAGNPAGVARALNAMGMVYDEQGDSGRARAAYDESLAILRRMGYKRPITGPE